MKYFALINDRTSHTSIHAPSCSMVATAARKNSRRHEMEGETAEEAKRIWDEDNQTAERGLPETTICPCVKNP